MAWFCRSPWRGVGLCTKVKVGFLLEMHVRETPHMWKAQWMHQCLDQRSLYHLLSRGGSFSLHCLLRHANLEARTRSRHLCAEATRRKVTFILGPSWQLRKFQAHFKSILQLPNRIYFKSIIALECLTLTTLYRVTVLWVWFFYYSSEQRPHQPSFSFVMGLLT